MKIIRCCLSLALLLFCGQALAQTPVLNVNPVLVDFGIVDVGASETRVLSLSNLTDSPLAITGFSASGDASFDIDVSGGSTPCGSENPNIDPNGFCTMEVTFAPSFPQSASGSVSFTPNGQASLSINARFLGEALDPDNGGGCSLSGGLGQGRGVWLLLMPLIWFVRRRAWA